MHRHLHNMHIVPKIALFIVFATLAMLAVGFGVMYLWNWLMPTLFGLTTIGYWQALGLCVLGRVLFGGWGFGHRRHGHWRHRLAERSMLMSALTPEEREKLSQHWGHHGSKTDD